MRDDLRQRHRGRAVAFIAVVVSLMSVSALPADAIPPPGGEPVCLANTVVNSMSVNRRSTFGGAALDKVRFSWNITKGCSSLELRVGGQLVSAVGSMEVSVPTSRRLSVQGQILGCCSATWYGPFVLAGRFIHYSERAGGSLNPGQPQATSGRANVDAAAREVVESLHPEYRNHFAGRRIEIHILPTGHSFDELPPWDENGADPGVGGLGNASDDQVEDEHGWWGPGLGVHSVGITATSGPYAVSHELGHAVLFHAPDVAPDVFATWFPRRMVCTVGGGCRPRTPQPEWVGCVSGDDYGGTNSQEYWAEGTVALFESGQPCPLAPDPNQYSQEYLAETDPQLDQLLRRVFDV
jgi:hypothetical protein